MATRFARFFCLSILFSALASLALPAARADEVYTFVVKKQEEKAKNRWSLADWLDTRDKMRLMDLWLAIHSPSPYEFFLSGDYLRGTSSGTSFGGWDFAFAAYASIFGLELQRQDTTNLEWLGLFHLRIFGFHAQATNITLEAGLRHLTDGSTSSRNALAGVDMTIYLARYFGVEGLYRHYFDSPPNVAGVSVSGNRYEGGAFIDFKFLRVQGIYFSEPSSLSSRSGVRLGTKVFF